MHENAIIDITYVIAQGPELYVERIDIVGNVRTTDEVIRREFEFAEGDAYNAALVQRTERNIRALDFFASVIIENRQGSRPDTTIIEVAVEEKSTGELSFGVGFSSVDNVLVGVSIGERNLLGTAQHLQLDLTASGNSQTIDLSFTEPYFLDRELSAGFDVFRVRRDLKSQSSFSREDIGGVLRVGYPLTEHLEQTVSYSFRTSVVERVPVNASRLVQEEKGRSTVSLIGERLEYDVRNDVLRPTSGYLVYQGTDLAGLGGDREFFRNTGGFSYFYPMGVDWTLNVRADGGVITSYGDEDIRLTDRFFLGGSNFRGFKPSGVGPEGHQYVGRAGRQLLLDRDGRNGVPHRLAAGTRCPGAHVHRLGKPLRHRPERRWSESGRRFLAPRLRRHWPVVLFPPGSHAVRLGQGLSQGRLRPDGTLPLLHRTGILMIIARASPSALHRILCGVSGGAGCRQ